MSKEISSKSSSTHGKRVDKKNKPKTRKKILSSLSKILGSLLKFPLMVSVRTLRSIAFFTAGLGPLVYFLSKPLLSKIQGRIIGEKGIPESYRGNHKKIKDTYQKTKEQPKDSTEVKAETDLKDHERVDNSQVETVDIDSGAGINGDNIPGGNSSSELADWSDIFEQVFVKKADMMDGLGEVGNGVGNFMDSLLENADDFLAIGALAGAYIFGRSKAAKRLNEKVNQFKENALDQTASFLEKIGINFDSSKTSVMMTRWGENLVDVAKKSWFVFKWSTGLALPIWVGKQVINGATKLFKGNAQEITGQQGQTPVAQQVPSV